MTKRSARPDFETARFTGRANSIAIAELLDEVQERTVQRKA